MNPHTIIPPAKTSLVIVTDLGLLRAYRVIQGRTDHHPHLELVDELRPHVAHQKISDQLSDQAGRFAKGSGASIVPGDLSSGEPHDLDLEQPRRLIKLLAGKIHDLLADVSVATCSVAASAPILRRLLDQLTAPVRAKIAATLALNLTKSDPGELLAHLRRHNRLAGVQSA